MSMTPALATLIDEFAAPLGRVPEGSPFRTRDKQLVMPPSVRPSHLVERVLDGHVLEPAEQAWFTQLLTLGLLRVLCASRIAEPAGGDPGANTGLISFPAADAGLSGSRPLSTGEQFLGIDHGGEVAR